MTHTESIRTTDMAAASSANKPLPRFNLKKRSISKDKVALSTVNSAFLSGLFADVAKVELSSSNSRCSTPFEASEDPRACDDSTPCKKVRLSKTKSMTRCGKSYKFLQEAQELLKSPSGAATDFFGVVHNVSGTADTLSRNDSLNYQLSCVTDSSSSSDCCAETAGRLAFPHLPSTITTSYKLTRKVSDLQLSAPETDSANPSNDTYGWFVEMEDDDKTPATSLPDPYSATATSSASLAFSAATAPKAANYDAEVEWAQAADTVDDVLGCFF